MSIYRGYRITEVHWDDGLHIYTAQARHEDNGALISASGSTLDEAITKLRSEIDKAIPGTKSFQGAVSEAETLSMEEINSMLSGGHL